MAATMEICVVCRSAILPDDLEWRTLQTARQTHGSPAEYEEMPFHSWCQHEERDDAEARAEARYRDRYGSEL